MKQDTLHLLLQYTIINIHITQQVYKIGQPLIGTYTLLFQHLMLSQFYSFEIKSVK